MTSPDKIKESWREQLNTILCTEGQPHDYAISGTECRICGLIKSTVLDLNANSPIRKVKEFCDCYEHDFRKAVIKLSQIIDMQPINDSLKATASMYIQEQQQIDKNNYVESLIQDIEILNRRNVALCRELREFQEGARL